MGQGGSASSATRQQNFRLPGGLIVALEAECGKGRRWRNKSAAVQELLEAELAPDSGPSEADPVPSAPARWSSVVNAADRGTLVRVADPDLFAADSFVRTPAGEVMRVRSVDGDLLTVDRGVGRAPRRTDEVDHDGVAPLRPGDEVCVVGWADSESEASPAVAAAGESVGAGSSLPSAPADGAEREGGCDTPAVPPSIGAEGGQGAALSVPAPPDPYEALREPYEPEKLAECRPENDLGPMEIPDGRAPFPVGRAELMEGRADSDGDRSAAAQEAELVDLAAWLAERTGAPVAVCRRRIKEGRVTISGDGFDPPGEHFDGPYVAKSRLDQLELDGERV